MPPHSEFEQFLDDLIALDEIRVSSFFERDQGAGPSVMVGCGDHATADADRAALIVNNKGTSARFGAAYTSVTRMMAAPPAGLLENWLVWAEVPLAPAQALGQFRLVVEDASPDALGAVLLLLMRLAGLPSALVPVTWIDAIDRWEREGVVDDPATSWPALASALAHRRFPVGSKMLGADVARAWLDGLRFLACCLRRGALPDAVSALPDEYTWHAARTALYQEEQTYLNWLAHATQVQLSLPMTEVADRRLLVDGLIVTEDQPTGAAKVFYRNDRCNASLGRGFTLAAHHRPHEYGTGNDFTIAVDPRLGVHLKELWVELERRESAKWAASGIRRPDDAPRRFAALENRWNQPWYLKEPECDLIGAPRSVQAIDARGAPVTVPGTLLTWAEIRDAIWTVFNPLNGIEIVPMREGAAAPAAAIPMLELPLHALASDRHGKKLLLAKWPPGATDRHVIASARALSESPIVERIIAGMIGGAGHLVMLDELPAPGAWEKVRLSGGFAVVTRDGMFVLDDWREPPLGSLDEIVATFHHAAHLDHQLREIQREVEQMLIPKRPIVRGRDILHAQDGMARAAALVGFRLASLRGREAAATHDPDARLIREALERQWGMDRRLSGLEQQIKSIVDALKTLGDARMMWLTRVVGTFGFAPYIASSLAEHAARLFSQLFGHQPKSESPPEIYWWFAFAVIFVLILTGLWRYFIRGGSLDARASLASLHGHPPPAVANGAVAMAAGAKPGWAPGSP